MILGQQELSYPAISYDGQRIFLETVEIKQGKKGKSKVTAKLINTGKVELNNIFFSNQSVLLNTHQGVIKTIGQKGLEDLYYSVANEKWNLAIGQTLSLSFDLIKKPVKSIQPQENETEYSKITDSKLEKEAKQIESDKAEENELMTQKIIDKIEIIEEDPKVKTKIEVEEKHSEQEVVQEDLEELALVNTEVEENSKETISEEPTNDELENLEKNKCSDLMIQNLEIVKQTKKTATIRYTIVNNGEGRAQLSKQSKNEQNLAVRAFLSSSNKLSRGAITLGGEILKLSDDQQQLKSGEQYIGIIKLPLYKLTKFTPYVVLQVDPYQQLIECDETNNVNTINLLESESAQKD